MASLDADTVALLSRRAYDIAGTTPGLTVFLNGKRIPLKTFKVRKERERTILFFDLYLDPFSPCWIEPKKYDFYLGPYALKVYKSTH